MLSELKTKLATLLGNFNIISNKRFIMIGPVVEIKPTHTQYGLGVREVYPASESRDKVILIIIYLFSQLYHYNL